MKPFSQPEHDLSPVSSSPPPPQVFPCSRYLKKEVREVCGACTSTTSAGFKQPQEKGVHQQQQQGGASQPTFFGAVWLQKHIAQHRQTSCIGHTIQGMILTGCARKPDFSPISFQSKHSTEMQPYFPLVTGRQRKEPG